MGASPLAGMGERHMGCGDAEGEAITGAPINVGGGAEGGHGVVGGTPRTKKTGPVPLLIPGGRCCRWSRTGVDWDECGGGGGPRNGTTVGGAPP